METAFSAEVASLRLSPRETFHLHRVLRLKPGDPCQIFNRNGWGAEAVVETVSQTEGALLRLKKTYPLKEKSIVLKVGQALPQKGKLDDLIRQAEELGVYELWALETERTIVKMRREAKERARSRWERIVIEAAKQSGNPVLMRTHGPDSFRKVLEEQLRESDSAFLFHPDPTGVPFRSVMEDLSRKGLEQIPSSIFLSLGPEGGFTEQEVRLAESRGVQKVFLGDSVLRVETAFLSVVGAIRFLTSE